MTAVIYQISRYFSRLEPVVGFSGTDSLNMLSEFSINCHGNHILEKMSQICTKLVQNYDLMQFFSWEYILGVIKLSQKTHYTYITTIEGWLVLSLVVNVSSSSCKGTF